MAERITQPTDADKLNWASDGTTYSSSDPGSAKRLTGYKPKDEPVAGPGEVIPAEDANWLNKTEMEMLQYFLDYLPREWTTLTEATAATGYRDLFRVTPPLGGMYSRLQQLFNVAGTAATGGNPNHICTDGEQMYYIAGNLNQVVIAASPNPATPGAEIWESSASATQFFSLCADGNYVYGSATNLDPGLIKIDRSNGARVSIGGTEYSCTELRTNGVYAVGIAPSSSSSKLVFWTVGAGAAAPTETGTQTITPLNGVAIDADSVYVGGTRSTYDVWAWDLATRANNWQITLPTTGAPTVAAITADGDCVYVATDRIALSAGGNANLFCLDRVGGSLLWTLDVGSEIPVTVDLVNVAVDDRYLFAVDDSAELYQYRLRYPEPSLVATDSDWNEVQCDGVSVIGTDSATVTNFMRHMLGGPSKTYMRVDGDDPTRRPMPGLLAVPTGEI